MRTQPLRAVAALVLTAAVAAPAGAQNAERDRRTPPPPLPAKAVDFPPFQERTLENGARVVVVENHEQPVVTLELRIRTGTKADPAGKAGVAQMAAALLDKGTATRSAEQIAESIDFVGGELDAGAGDDWSRVRATVLTEFVDTALALLSDVVVRPTFPEEELETERRRLLSALQVQLSQPGALASRAFLREVYGTHPYGASTTPETVRALGRDDLVAFHAAHFRPENALFVVAGDVRPDEIVARLNASFAGWTGGGAPRVETPAPPAREAREIVFVHKPGSVQAVVRVGHLLPPATDEDWVALDVARQIVGGGTTGWFFRILRGEKGYTYGAYAQAAKRREPGYFQAAAEVRNEVADSALATLFELLDRIRAEPVSEEDLRIARDYMVGSFPLSIETPQAVAGQVATNRLLGLPDDYLARYRERVAAVTAADVQRVAREHIRPDEAVVVVVGDADAILDRVAPFGPVRLVDVNGRPLEREALEAPAEGPALDASALGPQTLVYGFSVQGNPIAELTSTTTRETIAGKDAVRVTVKGGGAGLSFDQDVAFEAATFAPIHSRVEQQMGPMRLSADLRVEDGRVVGTVAEQGTEHAVDAEAPGGTLLPGMDEPALWVADLASTPELRGATFSAQTRSVVPFTARVVEETRVTVPAGEFDVYRLEVSAGPAAYMVLVRKEAPHVVVRQVYAGMPLVVELKEIR